MKWQSFNHELQFGLTNVNEVTVFDRRLLNRVAIDHHRLATADVGDRNSLDRELNHGGLATDAWIIQRNIISTAATDGHAWRQKLESGSDIWTVSHGHHKLKSRSREGDC